MAIAIIPARGGSKRIPDKNIKLFLGKPIISYAIHCAMHSNLFDEVMVSTDSDKIAEIALKAGASVPFMRSAENSNDFATTADVLTEVFDQYKKIGRNYETACCIYPTAALINPEHLKAAEISLNKNNFDSVFSVLQYSYPIQRALKTKGDKIEMIWPENKNARSQDLETSYHDAGQFYFFKVKPFHENKNLFTGNSGFITLSEFEAQDIDNAGDWAMAELKYKYLQQING